MAITFSCSCGKKLKVQDTMVGKKVRCPECNAISVARAEDEEPAVAEVSEDQGTVRTKARDTETQKVPPPVQKPKKRVFRAEGDWEVGDEVFAPSTADYVNVAVIKKFADDKALVEFTNNQFTGWVFTRSLQPVAVSPDQVVKITDNNSIRDAKIVDMQGDRVRVIFGYNFGLSEVQWSDEQGQFDIDAVGVPCKPIGPGAMADHEIAFYEELKAGDRVWAPWEKNSLYAGKVRQVKGDEVRVDYDNGNRAWVLLGQIKPFDLHAGHSVYVQKRFGGPIYGARVLDCNGKNVQVEYDDGGKKAKVTTGQVMWQRILASGPDARPTKIAGGFLIKFLSLTCGALFIAMAAGLVIVGEQEAAKRAKTIAEGAASCVAAAADKVDPANDGKLIHVAGETSSAETLADDKFPVVAKGALKLIRTVEIRQWIEHSSTKTEKQNGKDVKVTHYTHEAKWVKDFVNSGGFHVSSATGKKPVNVGEKFITDAVVRAKVAKVGAYVLNDSQIDRLGAGEKLAVTDAVVSRPPPELDKKVKVLDGVVYICMYPDTDPSNPNVGDLRITFSEVKPQPVSIVAKLSKGSFEPWTQPDGTKLDELRTGLHDKETMFKEAEKSNNLTVLVWRVVCGLGLLIGVYLAGMHWWLWPRLRRK